MAKASDEGHLSSKDGHFSLVARGFADSKSCCVIVLHDDDAVMTCTFDIGMRLWMFDSSETYVDVEFVFRFKMFSYRNKLVVTHFLR